MQPQPSSPDPRWLGSLPNRDSLELGAYDTAPGTARRRLELLLKEWSLPELIDKASVVATELVTNSVLETASISWTARRPPVRLWLRGGPGVLAVLVWDAITTPPAPRAAGPDDESGRGLAIVGALSTAWGYYETGHASGKVTWAIIDTP